MKKRRERERHGGRGGLGLHDKGGRELKEFSAERERGGGWLNNVKREGEQEEEEANN